MSNRQVIVTDGHAAERTYATGTFLTLPGGQLLVGPDESPVAVYAAGNWESARFADAEASSTTAANPGPKR